MAPPATSTPPLSSMPAPSPGMAQAPPSFAPTPAPAFLPETSRGLNKNKLVLGGAVAAAAAIAAFAVLGGSSTGKLVITVAGPGGKSVEGVEVLVDKEVACTESPCILEKVPAGHRVLQVRAPGYEEKAARSITIEGGKEYAEDIELSPASTGAGLKVAAEGSGLELYIDGKYIGPLPQQLDNLEPGRRTVKISGSSIYAPYEEEVSIEANKVVELEPKLQLLKGTVTIELGDNAKGADIYFVDGSNKKPISTKTFPLSVEVPADKTYRVVAERRGYDSFEKEVSFTGGSSEQRVTIELSAAEDTSSRSSRTASAPARTPSTSQTSSAPSQASSSSKGTLNINSIPVSTVILDGRPLGQTPKVGVSVSPGSHTVVFVHPEHGRKVRAVTVQAGQTATAAVRFP